jgi:uncharacterized protein
MPRIVQRAFALFFGCSVVMLAAAVDGGPQPIPALQARVTDLTATLDATQRQTLETELAALEQRKGAQLAVLIVPSTEPEDIEQYAIRVFDQWKLGRKGVDDGALLIVAKNDRRVRIEVARGLEGAIPDAASARIIREYITPRFRGGDYYGGIHDAVGALSSLVDGEPLPQPWTGGREPRGSGNVSNAILFGLFAGFWARAMFGRASAAPRAGLVGAAAGGAGWLISGLLPLGIGLGVLGVLFGLMGGGGGGGFANRGGWGGWGGGGGFGGGGWGGGSGGGGFSGGGGISAGGGASGSW